MAPLFLSFITHFPRKSSSKIGPVAASILHLDLPDSRRCHTVKWSGWQALDPLRLQTEIAGSSENFQVLLQRSFSHQKKSYVCRLLKIEVTLKQNSKNVASLLLQTHKCSGRDWVVKELFGNNVCKRVRGKINKQSLLFFSSDFGEHAVCCFCMLCRKAGGELFACEPCKLLDLQFGCIWNLHCLAPHNFAVEKEERRVHMANRTISKQIGLIRRNRRSSNTLCSFAQTLVALLHICSRKTPLAALFILFFFFKFFFFFLFFFLFVCLPSPPNRVCAREL